MIISYYYLLFAPIKLGLYILLIYICDSLTKIIIMARNKVTTEQILEAIEYLHTAGFAEEMTTDKKYYTEILLKCAGNVVGMSLDIK